MTWGPDSTQPAGVAVFQGDGAARAAAMFGAAPRLLTFMHEIVEAAKRGGDAAKVLAQVGNIAEVFLAAHDHLSAQHGSSLVDAGVEDGMSSPPGMTIAERAAIALGAVPAAVH